MKVGGAFKSPMKGEREGSRTGQEELQTVAQFRESLGQTECRSGSQRPISRTLVTLSHGLGPSPAAGLSPKQMLRWI